MPRMFIKAREPFSSYSHFVGAVAAACGLAIMLIRAVIEGVDALTGLSVLLFGLSLIALYSASAVYHYARAGEQVLRVLKKLDHSMIYVLIAGSYTPIVLKYMQAPGSYLFLAIIWGIALFGIAVKLIWIDAPRFLGTILYLLMGWAVIFRFDVVLSMPAPAITLLAIGGLSYTIGGVIYILKKPNLSQVLGFHELFHLFVLAGSVAHYLMVFWFVL
ncbi:MAG: PAQR family membrane homeostasis protein TrhA [Butyricicoccus pullicaecorum]